MKNCFLFICLAVVFSCKKDKSGRQSFNEKELDFVSYTQGQAIKLIDSNNSFHLLNQNQYLRDFAPIASIFGSSQRFYEKYEVSFTSSTAPSLIVVDVRLYGKYEPYQPGTILINACNYIAYTSVDSLKPINSLVVNGKNYLKVYPIKSSKDGIFNSSDTATIFWNKEFGLIQLLFPTGKSISRTD